MGRMLQKTTAEALRHFHTIKINLKFLRDEFCLTDNANFDSTKTTV